MDVFKFAQALLKQVHEYVQPALDGIVDGFSAELRRIEQRISEIPAGKDGAPGRDGVDGKDGLAGTHGEDGAPGLKGVDGRDGAPGRDGVDGKDGAPGRDGVDGKDGAPGADGKSVTIEDVKAFMESELSKWALDFERRGHDTLQRCVDRIAKPLDGKDGVDGVGFDDLTVEQDGARTFKLRFVRGERVKEFTFSLPVVLDCGVYVAAKQYTAGDAVSFGGSLWIAQKDSPGKPGDVDSGWRLAVKKGRDGRDRETPVAG